MRDSSFAFYICQWDRADMRIGVTAVDPATAVPSPTAWLRGVGRFRGHPVADPGRHRIYLPVDGEILVVDTETLSRATGFNSGIAARHLSVSADGSRLYVTSGRADGVVEVDCDTGAVLRVLGAGVGGVGVCVPSGDGGRLYVGSSGESPTVRVLDLATGELGESVGLGAIFGVHRFDGSVQLALAPDEHTLYAWHSISGRLTAFDTATFTVTARREWISDEFIVDMRGPRVIARGNAPVEVVPTADGQFLVAVFPSGPGALLDAGTLVDRHEFPIEGMGSFTGVRLGPDGTVCATGGMSGAVIGRGGMPQDRREFALEGIALRAVVA